MKQPMKMGQEILGNFVMEKYLGGIILMKKCEEIIQIANTPVMGGLRNSNIAFKLFEALVIQPLLHNFL